MRNVIIGSVGVLLILMGNITAQEEKKIRTLGEYKEVIKIVKNWSENMDKEDFYKDFKFKHKETKKEKKFSELELIERKLFMVFQAEKLSENLDYLHEEFKKDLDNMKKKKDAIKKAKKDDEAAGTEDITEHISILNSIRKSTATKYEAFMEEFFKSNKTKFSSAEIGKYMQKLRKFHDDRKLIERKVEKK